MTFLAEALNATIFTVGHIDDPLSIDGDGMRNPELSRTVTRRAPFPQSLACFAIFNDPGVRVTIGNEYSIVREGNVGGTAEGALGRCRKTTHIDLQLVLTVDRELMDHGTAGIDSPDISLVINPNAVRNLV